MTIRAQGDHSTVSFALPARLGRLLLASLALAAVALTGCLASPEESRAAKKLELAIQDDGTFLTGAEHGWGPSRVFRHVKALGVTRIRVNLIWAYTMPRAQYVTRSRPASINYDFSSFDALIDEAAKRGVRVHVSLTGPAPRWGTAARRKVSGERPSSRAFGEWVELVAEHFAGRVDRYSIWNEPNWKTWLGPLRSGPAQYRSLYIRGYNAIKEADPAAKVLIGETSPYSRPGLATSPLAFLRKVTCVDRNYRRVRGCAPLRADGYAHHPYDFRHAPNYQYPGADNVTMGTLSRLTRALDRLKRAGALRVNGGGRMPLYLTEYGYFASGHRALSSRTSSRYLGQAYSMALRNPRVKSQLQYLLLSPRRGSDQAFFDLGLMKASGRRHPHYFALARWFRSHRSQVLRPDGRISLPPAPPTPTG
jgi:hypothetical protein